MKFNLTQTVLYLMLSYSGCFLVQLWLEPFSSEFFSKLTITYVVVFLTTLAAHYWLKSQAEDAQMKRDKFID